jgi:hypothetical protein
MELKDLYKKDFVLWVEENLKLLRDRQFDKVDWENLLEEIEDLARKYVDDALVLMAKILAGLYRYENFKEDGMGAWVMIVNDSRAKLERLFERMPSLRNKAVGELETAWRFAVIDMMFYYKHPSSGKLIEKYFSGKEPTEKDFPKQCPYSFQQIMEYKPWIE